MQEPFGLNAERRRVARSGKEFDFSCSARLRYALTPRSAVMNLNGILVLAFAALMPSLAQTPGATRIAQTVWDFDSLGKIGGHAIKVEGHPKIVESPVG